MDVRARHVIARHGRSQVAVVASLILAVGALSGCGQTGAGGGSSGGGSQPSWKTAVELGMSCEGLNADEHAKCEQAYEAEKNHEAVEREVNAIKEAEREERRLGG